MSFFLGCRGRIYHHRWLPDGEVRSAVVLLHGYGEHLGLTTRWPAGSSRTGTLFTP